MTDVCGETAIGGYNFLDNRNNAKGY